MKIYFISALNVGGGKGSDLFALLLSTLFSFQSIQSFEIPIFFTSHSTEESENSVKIETNGGKKNLIQWCRVALWIEWSEDVKCALWLKNMC